jgi:subtilisin family serine protease/subtilisin-like proprotein convertase family protein
MNWSGRLFFGGVFLLGCVHLTAQTSSAALRFRFREPQITSYRIEQDAALNALANSKPQWLKAWPAHRPARPVELSSRVVVQLKSGTDLASTFAGSPLQLSRTITTNLFIFQAPDALVAVSEAQRLAQRPEVSMSYPVMRRPLGKHSAYAAKPNDPYFFDQWNLENRAANGTPLGPDLNVRAAWPVTRGAGSIIAVADDGVELTHPELAARASNDLHFNFTDEPNFGGTTNAMPVDPNDNHSTAVAGLALAEGNNQRGMIGVAPDAQLASWKIFTGAKLTATEERMMDMFQYHSNSVSVQNHSWGSDDFSQLPPLPLESLGISNALAFGRAGRGVVMVRSAGNGRGITLNANDDGYANDPRIITVASVRSDGRAARYSNPGACLLVAAPGGDLDRAIFMTDRQGSSAGFNTGVYADDFADYVFNNTLGGTSFSTPQISGLAALILSANPNLTCRDVQQILILSSRHFDLADPDLRTNGAGFRFSHNVGFGVPDAGQAVTLARNWINRPALTSVTATAGGPISIPDDGLRVLISGTNVPLNLVSIPASGGTGLHADDPTPSLPVVDVGLATNAISLNLSGKCALIQNGVNTPAEKIQFAAQAGAAFAIIYNNTGTDERFVMRGTDFSPIPAVMIGQSSGLALRNYLQQEPTAQAQVRITDFAGVSFTITNTLICEHVAVRVQTDHPRRGDLRITLRSPSGVHSVLQQVNFDNLAGPTDWTYYSTQYFYEGSSGNWLVAVTDEEPFGVGNIWSLELKLSGVAITDTDADGLDDGWETTRLGSLAFGPKDDPDGDGYNNAREQVMGTDPNAVDAPFRLDLSVWNEKLARLSWPGVTSLNYEMLATNNVGAMFPAVTNLSGRFPETECFVSYTNFPTGFFRVRSVAP